MSRATEQVTYLCRHCGAYSSSEVIVTEPYVEPVEDEQGNPLGGGLDYRYRLVRCTACFDLSLLLAMRFGWNHGVEVYDDDTAVYPAPPRTMSTAVPKPLQDCFQEARACYQARAYTASAIMCRRALDLLSIDRGVKQGRHQTLGTSLEKLKEKGDIDQRLFDWCKALQLAGNEAAHDVSPSVTKADARDMSDIAEAIIDYVYVFQDRYEEFKERREPSSRRDS
jgi:hypothetical protein